MTASTTATARSSPIRALRTQSLISLVGAAGGAVAGFGLVLAATRSLSQDDAGAAFLAIAVFSIVSRVAQLGSGSAIVHLMTTGSRGHGGDRGLTQILGIALPAVTAASTVLGIAMYATAGWFSALVDTSGSTDALADSLRLAAVFVLPAALLTVVLDATRGFADVRPSVAVGKIGRPGLQLIGLVIALLADAGATGLVLAWTASTVPALAVAAVWLRAMSRIRRADEPTVTTAVDRTRFWAVAVPQTGVDTIRTLVRWQDGIVIGLLLGAGPAAVYVAVTRLVKVASLVNHAFSDVVAPHVGEQLGVADMDRAGQLYRASTWWLILLLGPIYLTTAAYAGFFAGIFGDDYRSAALVLVILALGKFAGSLVGSVEAVLIVNGDAAVNLNNHAVSLITNAALNLALVPVLGLEGAAVAWVASILITNYGPLLQLRKRTGLTPFDRTTVLVIAIVGSAVAVPAIAVHILSTPSAITVVAATTVAITSILVMAGRLRARLELDEVFTRRSSAAER